MPMDTFQLSLLEKWLSDLDKARYFYPESDSHFYIIKELVRDWLASMVAPITEYEGALAKMGGRIDIGICDNAIFGGYSAHGFCEHSGESSSLAQINLGIFPKALALANRAHHAGPAALAGERYDFDFEDWSIRDESIGMLWIDVDGSLGSSRTATIDCATLCLFHEISHCQEPFPRTEDAAENRAIEACADEGAGYLFARNLQRDLPANDEATHAVIVNRLGDAAFFLVSLFYWVSTEGKVCNYYPHPCTRLLCFLRGACFALYGAEIHKWSELIDVVQENCMGYGMALELFTPEDLRFWDDEEAIEKDMRLFFDETMPLMHRMREKLCGAYLLSELTQHIGRIAITHAKKTR